MTRACECGQPARGKVPADDVTPTWHTCRQCSPEHCLLRAYYLESRQVAS